MLIYYAWCPDSHLGKSGSLLGAPPVVPPRISPSNVSYIGWCLHLNQVNHSLFPLNRVFGMSYLLIIPSIHLVYDLSVLRQLCIFHIFIVVIHPFFVTVNRRLISCNLMSIAIVNICEEDILYEVIRVWSRNWLSEWKLLKYCGAYKITANTVVHDFEQLIVSEVVKEFPVA